MRSHLLSSALLAAMAAVAVVDAAPKSLAIFRAGQHTSVDGRTLDFTQANIDDMIDSYDPAVSEAPIVIGHPGIEAPAYGWARSLSGRDGTVFAEPHQVEPAFAEMANAGRYKKISASIYMPDSPGNPKPGHYYLRHIGFLGAAAPAVKGLPSAQFAESQQPVEFSTAAPEAENAVGLITKLLSILTITNPPALTGVIAADQVGNPATHFSERIAREPAQPTERTDMSENKNAAADFAARETTLNTREQGIKEREALLAAREQKDARAAAVSFAAALVAEGKILPRHASEVVEVQMALTAAAPVSFAEGDTTATKSLRDVFTQFLTSLPKQMDFAEKSRDTGAALHAVNFAAPAGMQVDPSRVDLYNKAMQYMATHRNTTLAQAAAAVGA